MNRFGGIWTGTGGDPHLEEGVIDLPEGERGDVLGFHVDVTELSFRERPKPADPTTRTRSDSTICYNIN